VNSNARESVLKSSNVKPALDREVIELLRNDAQLLAIADAVAATQRQQHGGVSASVKYGWRARLRRLLERRAAARPG
jgi:hypothetical protein